jgi:putative phosphoribosyl transferase
MGFVDRRDAGRRLGEALAARAHRGVVVLGLPRGGVPVAEEVAARLGAPLDVLVVRKIGVPDQPELAMGAIGEGGVRVMNDEVLIRRGISASEFAAVEARERVELERRARTFREGRGPRDVRGSTVIIVDDGLATGSSARAACSVARSLGVRHIVLAVPVAPHTWREEMGDVADEYVALETPSKFYAVGEAYENFDQTSDEEVIEILRHAHEREASSVIARDDEVEVRVDDVVLEGHLRVPANARGVVVFAHGSGSSRHSPRNRYVASVLNDARVATLLFDLLTSEEEADRANVFDIELLAGRLVAVTTWLRAQAGVATLPLGLFGASTGAAAALWAAAQLGDAVAAVVSRGGRPDLAGASLADVVSPTLLIVGGDDDEVLALNRRAKSQMPGVCELVVVAGATHLFEEPGTLERAAQAARDWFIDHLEESASAS